MGDLIVAKQRIAAAWEGYRKAVINPAAPEVQVHESQMAFYGGARAFLTIILTGLSSGDEPSDSDLDMMDEIEAELTAFADGVAAGIPTAGTA